MEQCIICGKTSTELSSMNPLTDEHIIPEALGNKDLKIGCVCKDCNSKLGTNVDNYFVDNRIVKMVRQYFKIPGKKGAIPNAFDEGVDRNGQRIRMDLSFKPTLVPHLESEDGRITGVAPNKKMAKDMVRKNLERRHVPEERIKEFIQEIDNTESHVYQPEVQFDLTIEFKRFFLEAVKIAYEYAFYKLGEDFLCDNRAKYMKGLLEKAKEGEFNDNIPDIDKVSILPSEMEGTIQALEKSLEETTNEHYHYLQMLTINKKDLVLMISLFCNPALSFMVLLSENADKYVIDEEPDLIQIKGIK